VGIYKTKVERPTYSPYLERELKPGGQVELDDEVARVMCDHVETVEYPAEQAKAMEAAGFDVQIDGKTAVGKRRVKGLLAPVKNKPAAKSAGKK